MNEKAIVDYEEYRQLSLIKEMFDGIFLRADRRTILLSNGNVIKTLTNNQTKEKLYDQMVDIRKMGLFRLIKYWLALKNGFIMGDYKRIYN